MFRYPFPWDLFAGLARDLPAGRRSLAREAAEMTGRMNPPPVVQGVDEIPSAGAMMVAVNHYQRRGLWIAWTASAVTAAVAARRGGDPPIRWLVTGGLRWRQWEGKGGEVPLMRQLLRRVADVYGMTALPLSGSGRRAAALRAWLRFSEQGEVLGVFPEGLAGRHAALGRPEEGFDALARWLAAHAIPIVPCGVTEVEGRLRVCFGSRVYLTTEDAPGERVMEAIAALVPREQRGPWEGN